MKNMLFQNLMETLVFEKLDSMMELSTCKCEKCRLDIAADALNHLPSKFVVTHKGSLYSKLEAHNLQHETDIVTALLRSIKKINENPRHEEIQE